MKNHSVDVRSYRYKTLLEHFEAQKLRLTGEDPKIAKSTSDNHYIYQKVCEVCLCLLVIHGAGARRARKKEKTVMNAAGSHAKHKHETTQQQHRHTHNIQTQQQTWEEA